MNRAGLWMALLGVPLLTSSAVPFGDDPPANLQALKGAIREAKSIEEKALQIQALGAIEEVDSGVVTELARFLFQGPADINFLLPTTAASSLGRLRGNRLAALSLVQAIPTYKKTPYVQYKLIAALGQVGHEAGLPLLEELLTGTEPGAASQSLKAIGLLPADLSLDSLLRTWSWMQARRSKVGDDVKKQYDRLGIEILKSVQGVSGEKYPTMAEMQLWWSRRAPQWKETAAARERERTKLEAGHPKTSLAPILLVELPFNESGGMSTANFGSSSGAFAAGALTRNHPLWSHDIPPPGGASSLDWGPEGGPFAVDLAGSIENLKNLTSFTVTGWINVRSALEGSGGNRILSWLDRDGVEIVHRTDGSLQVGINQKAESSDARTPPMQIPILDLKVQNAVFMNWRFFAVTYDGTAASGQLKIYLGTRDLDAKVVFEREGPAGKVGPRIAPGLSIGNVPPLQRPLSPKCSFRGLIDEVRIFGSTGDSSGVLDLPAVIQVQGRM
jgi:hypothetical protein